MSRNKREGRYAGKLMGKHWRMLGVYIPKLITSRRAYYERPHKVR